jgi:hypothetical protein
MSASRPKSPRRNTRPRKERHIVVRSVRRDPPDLKLLARALVEIVLDDLEKKTGVRPKVPPPPGEKHY